MLRGGLTACFQSTFGDPLRTHPVIVFNSTVINDWSQIYLNGYLPEIDDETAGAVDTFLTELEEERATEE